MDLYLGGVLLPNFANDGFNESYIPNAPQNITLDGTLFVDFINNRRQWNIKWDYLTAAEYATIKAVYDRQFTNHVFPAFIVTAQSIATAVYMTINTKNLKWNGSYVYGFEITLDEQYAIS